MLLKKIKQHTLEPFYFQALRVLSHVVFSFAYLMCAVGNSAYAQMEGRGTDPLTSTEESRALTIGQVSAQLMAAKASAATAKVHVPGLNPVQFLYTSLYLEEAPDQLNTRLAEVFYYNYTTDEVFRQIIDLQESTIREETVASGLDNQPFVTPVETEAAFQMLLSHAKFGPLLRNIYRKTSKKPLISSTQMRGQAGLLFPTSKIGTPLEPITRVCATHRCVQIFLHAGDGTLIDTNNIVLDLSVGAVLWR